ncbi:uncharacterized protein PRCAT00001473001 [Priceomyces carsonii]|uniref:uncharacterized protein n=1 Tax=Priceomyces carsonii TaxID=28549 RepID=UPI002ED8E57B|nr:unnamed protein product [Priceomyces carsonii]
MLKLQEYLPHERMVIETEDELEKQGNPLISHQNTEPLAHKNKGKRNIWSFFDEYEYRTSKPRKFKFNFRKESSSAEKKLILKLDILITLYGLVGYWCKFFDSSNLSNAYVSGLKEDIGMKGNDLIDTQVIYGVGAIIFTLPFIYILPRFSPPYVLLIGEFIWSTFTLATAGVTNVKALKAFRFIIGAAETSFFPVIHYSFSSW